MPVLTRDEAQTRARLIDVEHYRVELDLTRGPDTFDSRTAIRFTARAAGDTFVELVPAELRTVTLDGQPLDPAALDDNRLPLSGLAEGAHELVVDAAMRYSHTGEGMHRFTDPTDGETYVYSNLCMVDVQRVFPAFDQPDLKAVFDLTVTAPEGWTVIANGVTEHLGDGTWQAAPTPLLSTYLVAVAAGPWHSIRTEHRGLPFGLHCRRSLAPYLDADADEILDATRACFDRYHEKFDEPYPFDSYDQAFVPEFNAGAMENPGLVTFRDEFVYRSAVTDTERQLRAMVIAHEMAHMWFGDLVTLKWWDDIWLNESFAEYMGYQTLTEATRYKDTWVDFGISRKAWGYDADQRPTTHPVAPDAVPDTASALLNFDGISYAKGASALRQLVTWLGEKDFLAGINTHFKRHKFGNATLADFIDSLASEASGADRDVHAWADTWLRTTGVDTLTTRVTDTDDGWTLTVDRTGSRPHRIAVGLYDRDPADSRALVLRERIDVDVPGEPITGRGPRPALIVPNDHDLTYAKVRLDPVSEETVVRGISGVPDPLTRAVLWNTLRDMVRDGQLEPATYLETAAAHLSEETDLAIVQGVLTFAHTQVADQYTAPADRPAALTLLTTLCEDLIRRTEDGSHPGLRLTAVRHLIDAAQYADVIRDWYDSGAVPGGPELDPELRWRILGRLSVLGAVDDAVIEAELAHDPSAVGQEGAARCHASLPDPQAKAAAWDAMFADHTDEPDRELSNYLFTATAQGFWQPEQADLLRSYLPRYFTDAVTLAERRGPAIATAVGRYAFPEHAVDPETLRLGEQCLSQGEPSPALRRKLDDQLDDLRRALKARQG
ncbi:aminopeptidase N [Streptomyces sp. VRA16 Mangrove soil]|uniref:aminopeptidase N n=1 Tax=Streptomyces sp. VRA16 Mangrove soil TaxID=2817434 RepID=UPI001A9D2D43|nr:aminopeptidase N [Streptomyces sp. VRA16 Mangrove soil]MBO1335429.1 aminopeptidase N [Streptomyces sp. VRA16 Mangrove soil]